MPSTVIRRFDYLADQRVFRPYLKGNLSYAWKPSQLLALANEPAAHFRPGTKWEYSNTNYLVLGLVVEAVTGKPLPQELEQRVFGPARLRSTTFDTQPKVVGRS